MRPVLIIALLIVWIFVDNDCFAQSNKRYKINRRTSKREIRRRQKEAYEKNREVNAFNSLQTMGSESNTKRDDIVWHSESANTVYVGAGNISLLNPSRYGLKPGLELSSVLAYDMVVPNLMIKKRWLNSSWIVSSRHGLYSATPGFHWAQNNGVTEVIDSSATIPFVLSIRNEILISRSYNKDLRCIQEQPYIVLTFGGGIDFGVPIGESTLEEMRHNLLTNRSPALTGQGATGYLKVRGDWRPYEYLILGTSLKSFFGGFTGGWAFENQTEIQTFILPNFSASIGYIFSYGKYNLPSNVKIYPFVDLSWYFGGKTDRQKGLFKRRMF